MLRKEKIEELSDEVLVQLLSSRKSNAALTELHARYSKKVLGFFIRMFQGDVDKSHDFVQDLFMKILDKHEQFDPNRKFYTWMFTIASNMCKTEFRDTKKMLFTSNEFESENYRMDASATWNENLADKKRFKYLIEKALMQLEDYHREAFVLRHIQGCSIAEMEEILGISKGTIKSRIYYATKKVAKVLQEFDPSKDEAHFNMN